MLKLLPKRWEKAWVKALGAADACDAVRFQDVLSTLLADEPAAGVLLTLSRHCAKAADPFQQYRVRGVGVRGASVLKSVLVCR